MRSRTTRSCSPRTCAPGRKKIAPTCSIITSEPGVGTLWFGRPWRDYSRVIFLDTRIDAELHPDGWREWTPGITNRLATAFYAEYGSTGIGAPRLAREPYSSQLSAVEAERWSAEHLLAGDDGWAPQKKKRRKS